MVNLLATLGLATVEAAGELKPNKYDGVVERSALVYSESKDQISHVITYKVTEGTATGGTKDEWFNFGNNPLDANGQHTTDPEAVVSFTPTWSEQNQSFYKKRLIDLGVPEDVVNAGGVSVGDLVGIPCTFGVSERNGFRNISFAEKRDVPQNFAPQATDLSQAATQQPMVQQPQPTPNVSQIPNPQNLGGLV